MNFLLLRALAYTMNVLYTLLGT